MRHYSPIDQLLIHADTALRTVVGKPLATHRSYPAENIDDCSMDTEDRRHVASLMRVNHSGEVSAQALYQGQALTARLPQVRQEMERAAAEENDHLDWCEKRVKELDEKLFRQPEGICFSPEGDMYISNEGQGGKGYILKFNIHATED